MYQHHTGLLRIFLGIFGSLSEERLKYWWDRKDEFGEKLNKFLLGDETPASPTLAPAFKVWKTIKLGLHKSIAAYRVALEEAKMRISSWASGVMDKPGFTVSQVELELDLVLASGQDLGFTESATRKDIYNRAKSRGLELCPAEVGLALRLADKDQPEGEHLLIGMEPITDSDGYLKMFDVKHDGGGRWLYSYCDNPDGTWNPGSRWVFVLPRK